MIILSVLNGSRLYGLEHDKSDYDILNIYMKDRKDYYLSQPDKVVFRRMDSINYQITYVDLITLCRQLLKCNPNYVIPLLFPHLYYADGFGTTLISNIPHFLDYEKVNAAFTGMINSIKSTSDITKKPNTQEKIRYIENFRDYLLKSLYKDKTANIERIKDMLDKMYTDPQ